MTFNMGSFSLLSQFHVDTCNMIKHRPKREFL